MSIINNAVKNKIKKEITYIFQINDILLLKDQLHFYFDLHLWKMFTYF